MRGEKVNPAVVRVPARPSDAGPTLVCLSFCGGGTGPYRLWATAATRPARLALICYPGREGRYAEPFSATWDELACDAADSVRSAAAGTEYVLFGHSMGGWMAFDVATRLADDGAPLPNALVVSSCNTPQNGLTERNRFPSGSDSDGDLVTWMRTGGLLPDYVRDDPSLTGMAIELMRSDIAVRDTYHYREGAVTSVPVEVLYGRDDPVIEDDVGARWSAVCRGGITVTQLPGGHFYTPEVWAELPSHIAALSTAPAPCAGGSDAAQVIEQTGQ